jgi:allantoate deiminase
VLEAQDVPLGVVTAINGATRATFTLTGEAGHAGTVPMALRRDALTGAAEIVLGIERRCGAEPDLVGTVGRIEALPGAVNVIPGEARFTIDLRAPRDAQRRDALDDILSSADGIAGRRGLAVAHSITYDEPAAVCDPRLIAALEAAVEAVGVRPLRLPSGAGHDGLAMVALCPIGMLFLRCRGGVSHHPAESVTAQDVDVAVRALVIFLRQYRGASRADRP